MYDRILLVAADGLDDGPLIPHGIAIAERFEAALDVLVVVMPSGGPYRFDVTDVDDLNRAAASLQADLEAERPSSSVDLTVAVRRGDPQRLLSEYANAVAADLVVRHPSFPGGDGSRVAIDAAVVDRPTLLIPRTDGHNEG